MIQDDTYRTRIEPLEKSITGIMVRKLNVKDKDFYILFIPQLTNREGLSKNIIKPLMEYNGHGYLTPNNIITSIITIDDVFIDTDDNKLINYITSGKSIVITSESQDYIVANTLSVEKRNIQSPEIESSLRAPRDAFNENFDSNLSLIRHRIKDQSLKIDYYVLGRRTKTSVALLYIQDVANDQCVTDLKDKLSSIDVDSILESGDIQKLLSDGTSALFPCMGIAERSDSACAQILDGKICILVDGSNLALIAPKTFVEFLDSGDDHYDNTFIAIFMKILRLSALIITLTISALYVAMVAFHTDIIPSQYILALAASRVSVPVNAVTEAILMELILEILREANVRLPKQIGSSIGIVGTIVIGQALVFAGLVSPLLVIIVSLSSMASYVIPDYTLMNPIRLLKFVIIILTGIFGLFGFIMGLTIVVIKISSISMGDIAYTEPVSPFNLKDMKDYMASSTIWSKFRPNFLKSKNRKRK